MIPVIDFKSKTALEEIREAYTTVGLVPTNEKFFRFRTRNKKQIQIPNKE